MEAASLEGLLDLPADIIKAKADMTIIKEVEDPSGCIPRAGPDKRAMRLHEFIPFHFQIQSHHATSHLKPAYSTVFWIAPNVRA